MQTMSNLNDTTVTSTYIQIVGEDAIEGHLKSCSLPSLPKKSAERAELSLRMSGMRSQADLAAHMINLTGGSVSPDELQAMISVAFPSARTGKGRHGSYYLSKARTNSLKGCTVPGESIPKAARVSKAKTQSLLDRIAQLEQFITDNKLEVPTAPSAE